MAGKQHLVMSAIGPDQVGLVEKISRFIREYEASIEDSKMAVFCGEFAIIMLVTGSDESLKSIESKQSELGTSTGLTVFTRWPSERQYNEPMIPCRLTASSLDHPGIVHRLTSSLSQAGINIESMETKSYNAPMSAAPMFRFEALIAVPGRINLPLLRMQMQSIGEEENIDIELTVMREG
jgi:glycine cleavage system transcriptional repressor